MTLRCEACGEPAWDDEGRYCIACGGRLVTVADAPPPTPPPEPEPEPPEPGRGGAAPAPEHRPSPPASSSPPEVPADPTPAPPRPVRAGIGDEVPVALVLAGVIALLLVLLGLLLLT